ncbi:nitroreductase family deazaflavin-dependent oxidoreductase [Actinopolymorpha alba]|uniref:nitroreductase family deazaflavin-dependent oxidoreductase n=1 Tax=Actinopolymorpha alba TaxID=533267 RepID=UPI0003642C7F|nr:nitroreductase family deazaflavin-dependent oxidoreductase [Actinopolymorpha alba]
MSDTNSFNDGIIKEFRANGGKVGGMFEGAPLLLLTTTGAKSGQPRTSPLVYLREGDRSYVFGSNGGGPAHPSWYHNLLADPKATVEVGEETFAVTATTITGTERDEIYARQVVVSPGFGDYERQTSRVIPVVALAPVD